MFRRDQKSSRDKNDKNSHHFKTPREKKFNHEAAYILPEQVCSAENRK